MRHRLAKRHVEELLGRYDADPVAALQATLQYLYDRPGMPFAELLEIAPIHPDRRRALLRHDVSALDALAAELNENRTIAP